MGNQVAAGYRKLNEKKFWVEVRTPDAHGAGVQPPPGCERE